MDAAHRALLESWVAGVTERPGRHCGVFAGTDGEPFGHRARPWDYPDILIAGDIDGDALVLELSDRVDRVDAVADVVPGDHAWGPGLRVSGLVAGSPADVWLV